MAAALRSMSAAWTLCGTAWNSSVAICFSIVGWQLEVTKRARMVAKELHKAKRHIGVVKSATAHVKFIGVLYLDMLKVALNAMAGILVTRMVLLRTGNLRFRVALIAAPPPGNKVGNRGKRTGRLIILAFVPCQPVVCAMELKNRQRQLGTLAKVIIKIVVVLSSDEGYGGEHAT